MSIVEILVNISTYVVSTPSNISPSTFSMNSLNFARQALDTFCPSSTSQAALPSPPAVTPAFFVCLVLIFSGAALRRACYRTLGRFYTFLHTTRKSHKLITHGPYSIVRHPGYTALVLVKFGTIGWLLDENNWTSGCCWALAGNSDSDGTVWQQRALLTIYIGWSIVECLGLVFVRARKEDESLRKLSRAEWDEYRKRVPYRCFPFIY